MTPPSVSDHYRSDGTACPKAVYRVVGTDGEAVTLLRVTDAAGTRVYTGELVTVRRDRFDGFDRVEKPVGNRPLSDVVRSRLEIVYWSFRAFGRQLVANPLPAGAAAAVLLFGLLGDGVVSLPNLAFGVAILVGSLGLAYVGSGRL